MAFASLQQDELQEARVVFRNIAKKALPESYKPESFNLPLRIANHDEQRAASQHLLQELAALYIHYQHAGLPFHADYSHQLFSRGGHTEQPALELAWSGNNYYRRHRSKRYRSSLLRFTGCADC